MNLAMFELLKSFKIAFLFLAALAIAIIFWKLYLYTSPNSLSYVIDAEEFQQRVAQMKWFVPSQTAELHIALDLDSH